MASANSAALPSRGYGVRMKDADVVKKFIFRYLSVPLTDGCWNNLVRITKENHFNNIIELNKFLNNEPLVKVLIVTLSMPKGAILRRL